MLYRKAYAKLMDWKSQENKKALCVCGARQIGKTTLIRKFAQENYENYVELNFIQQPQAIEIFSGALDADMIITNLTAFTRKPMIPGKTLVLFDEVQECPNTRTAIKFLVEDGRFDYIESGSLLGIRYNDVRSYPVGYEEIYQMYPMDFEEYLYANGVQESTVEYLGNCFEERTPVAGAVHETVTRLFQSYIGVGGMPQVVKTYVDTHDIGRVIENQNDILNQYRLDISKYASGNDKIKIKAIFDSIPSQLNDKNRRFFLNQIDENGRQNRYKDSFQWLEDAGVALACFNVTHPQPPLQLNEKHNLFKLFMNDTGLLCTACMENIQFDILNGNLEINLGSILENVIAQQIRSSGFSLNFFGSKKYGELDFVIQNGSRIELVEVKSGKDYRKHSSLDKVLTVSKWKFHNAYVFCKGNIEVLDDVVYLPWYEVMFLKSDKIPIGMKYEIDLSGL